MELTKSELEIMDVFWTEQEPVSRGDLLAQRDKSWKDSSIHVLLNGLLRKGALRQVGYVRCRKTLGRTFLPEFTREEYYAGVLFDRRNKPDITALLELLLQRPEVTGETLDRVQVLLDKRRGDF